VVDHDDGDNSALRYSIVQSPESDNPVFVVDRKFTQQLLTSVIVNLH